LAEEAKGVPTVVWVLLALVVVWFLYQKTVAATKAATGTLGKGIGQGAAETLITKGSSALGSFLGGLFSSKSGSAATSDDTDADGEFTGSGGYDTSSFRVYEDD
jgi:hypothetical protein